MLCCVWHVCPTENGLNLSVSPMCSPDNYDFFITLPMIVCLLVTYKWGLHQVGNPLGLTGLPTPQPFNLIYYADRNEVLLSLLHRREGAKCCEVSETQPPPRGTTVCPPRVLSLNLLIPFSSVTDFTSIMQLLLVMPSTAYFCLSATQEKG